MFIYDRYLHFRETDAAGVVYFSEILNLCHEAYEASLRQTGIDLKIFFSVQGAAIVPIVHAEADYFAPLYCGDRLRLEMTAHRSLENKFKTKSPTQPSIEPATEFELRYQLYVEGRDRSAATAKTRHVCLNPQTRQRQPFPPDWDPWFAIVEG